jgi:UTP--glucose-1-phosphate uridylyltransferase
MRSSVPAQQVIDKAVIPAAGLGTRMLPITKSIPKEMLPAGRKPLLQLVVEEAVSSGLSRICVVVRRGKEVIRDYFSAGPRRAENWDAHLEELEQLLARCELTFVEQRSPRGLGDALLEARDFVGADSFVMMIPDQLMLSGVPATRQLLERCDEEAGIWTSLVKLPVRERRFFAGARGFEFERAPGADTFLMGRIQTEDETRAAYRAFDYELRGFGRTVYPPEIFDYLGAEFINPASGEVDLLKTFEKCAERVRHRGALLDGEACDLGTFEGYYHYLPRILERQA